MMRTTIIAIAAALALPAHADPDRISVLLGSSHLGARHPFEEVNPGVFLTWEDRAFGLDYSLGVYRNSFGRMSVAGTAALPVWERGKTQAALFAGVALYPGDGWRFRAHAGDWVPIAGLQIRHGNAFAQIMPGDGRPVRAVVSFGLTFKLSKRNK